MDIWTLLSALLHASWSASEIYLKAGGFWLPRVIGGIIVLFLTLSLLHRLLLHASVLLLVRRQYEMKRNLMQLRMEQADSE